MTDAQDTAPDKQPLPRNIRGKRPQFFSDPAVDHLLATVLELSAELWVSRSRQAALESYLAKTGVLDTAEFETFQIPEEEQEALQAWRSEFMQRLFRTVEGEASTAG
ncbi:MAG: hypothetical protein AAF607_09815 [Pseudomonadota bacterium]